MYVFRSPQKGSLLHMGKNVRSLSTEPPARRRNAYVQWGAAWFPKGIVNDTAVSTPVPCSLQHDPSTLAWVDQSPVSHVCCSNPHQGIPFTTVTAYHVTQGVQYRTNLRYPEVRMRGWIYGYSWHMDK